MNFEYNDTGQTSSQSGKKKQCNKTEGVKEKRKINNIRSVLEWRIEVRIRFASTMFNECVFLCLSMYSHKYIVSNKK